MLKRLRSVLLLILISFVCVGACAQDEAESTTQFYSNKTKLFLQQVDLLRHRLVQAQSQLKILQAQQQNRFQTFAVERVDKKSLDQADLDIAVAKSNLDSIYIELSEAQQTAVRIEKDMQEIDNQLNVFSVFGVKVARTATPDVERLQNAYTYRKDLLHLIHQKIEYLTKLQKAANAILQLNHAKRAQIETILKNQVVLQLKEQQTQSAMRYQEQQNNWLAKLNELNGKVVQLEDAKNFNKTTYDELQNEIYYVNENISLTYLQMLISRYQEQLQQLRISIGSTSSITLLNNVTDQIQVLTKQLAKVNDFLKDRLSLLTKRKALLGMEAYNNLEKVESEYKVALGTIAQLNKEVVQFRLSLDQVLQQELSSRQGLPALGSKAWLDLGSEILLAPKLGWQVVKNLLHNTYKSFNSMNSWALLILLLLESMWISLIVTLSYFLKRLVTNLPDHVYGHLNLKWLFIKLVHRNLPDLAIIGNLLWFFSFCDVPLANYSFLVSLSLVWFFFKVIILAARLCLVESVHDRAGHDVRLYHQLKWFGLIGGVVTGLTVFMQHLPVIYEVKDLFERLFLFFLLIASLFLFQQWELLPNLILPHIDTRRTYLKRIVKLLGLLIPFILLVNSIIGLFGFVNLILTIAWYESIFILVLVGYLLLRGFLNDGMELVSRVVIRHVTNGWLWTEAFLKPIDRLLHIVLFLIAWAMLFLLYGWDQQSPVVERLQNLLHYRLIDILNTTITPLSVIELAVVMSFLYWAAKWTREFVYRLLLSRTKDMGIRNSIAILSQYTMIAIGVFVALRLLGIDFRALTFVVTAFAFGVGLGLRDLVNNFACGFLLLLERPLRVGDTVEVNGYEGEVTHIGGRAVTIRTWDHMDVIVPNADIFSKSFVNWTAKDNIVRTVIPLKVNRNDSPHDVQAVIHQVLHDHDDVLLEPAPEVFLKELTDGLIEFEVRYFMNLRQVKSRVGLRSEVLMAIWEAFEKHGIQAPYPHHEVHFKGPLPFSGR